MIRTAKASDAPAIAALWNQIIADTTITFTTTPKTTGEIAQIIADPARFVHVAQREGGFAGFALVGPFRNGVGYARTIEHTVYLRETAQGYGLGTGLMHAVEVAAIVAGHHVMVGALSGSNSDAIGFHKSLGFQQVGRVAQVGQKNGEWHDLVLMQKILQNGH